MIKFLVYIFLSFIFVSCSASSRFSKPGKSTEKKTTRIFSSEKKSNENVNPDSKETSSNNNTANKIPSLNFPLTSSSLFAELIKKQINVLLSEKGTSLEFIFEFPVKLISGSNILEIPSGKSFSVNIQNGKLYSGISHREEEFFEIHPVNKNEFLNFNSKTFRGIFKLINSTDKVLLINVVDLDDYLKSVAASELDIKLSENDFEGIKAFTVCVRNFAFMKMLRSKGIFDVYADTRDQVYYGVKTEKEIVNRAVVETSDLVLMSQNELAQTFYYSSCGGSTEDCGNVFTQKNVPYLIPVKDGNEPNCAISPFFNWNLNFTSEELINSLVKANHIKNDDYKISNIEIKSRFTSGRVNELLISLKGKTSKEILLTGNSIRWVLRNSNGNILRSTMFDIENSKENGSVKNIKITGKGSGHGVGFCQWGALYQARKGKRFDEILYFYYPGTFLERF